MAKASSPQGRPASYKNLSPFGGKAKGKKESSGKAFMLIGVIGLIAALALVARALMLKG